MRQLLRDVVSPNAPHLVFVRLSSSRYPIGPCTFPRARYILRLERWRDIDGTARRRKRTQKSEETLHRVARRPARARRHRRHLLSPRPQVRAWRLARRHRLLRPLRLSHHWPAHGRARGDRHRQPPPILAASRAAPVPGHRARGRRRDGALRPVQPSPAHQAAPRRRPVAVLVPELVVRLPRPVVLRVARRSLAAHAFLVTCHRGAVLPRLAHLAAAREQARCEQERHPPRLPHTRRHLRGAHVGALQSARRPHPRLLRHRHARLLPSHRRMALAVLAWPGPHRAGNPQRALAHHQPTRRHRRALTGRYHLHDGLYRRLLGLHVPRRHHHLLGAHRRAHRRARAPAQPARQVREPQALRLDRPALLRHLPVALPRHPAAQAAQRPRRLYLVVRPRRLRHNLHGLGAVLHLRGKPHTSWCNRQGAAKMA